MNVHYFELLNCALDTPAELIVIAGFIVDARLDDFKHVPNKTNP